MENHVPMSLNKTAYKKEVSWMTKTTKATTENRSNYVENINACQTSLNKETVKVFNKRISIKQKATRVMHTAGFEPIIFIISSASSLLNITQRWRHRGKNFLITFWCICKSEA